MTWHEILNPAKTPIFISFAIEFQFPLEHLIYPPLLNRKTPSDPLFHALPFPSWNPNLANSAGFAMKGGKSKSESKRAEPKLAVNKKASSKPARKPSKKAAKDPDKPKRPASAFFVFMEEFRKKFNEENPNNKSVSAVGKAAGQKWKSMSEADKAPYVAKAEKRKADYEKEMKAYNKKQAAGPKAVEEDESEKSMSEVNDEDDGEDGSGEDEDDDDDD